MDVVIPAQGNEVKIIRDLGSHTVPKAPFVHQRVTGALAHNREDPPPENANAALATGADGDLSKDGPIPVKRQLSRDATRQVA